MSAELSTASLGADATSGLPPATLSTTHSAAPGTTLGRHPRHAGDTYDQGDPRAVDGQETCPRKKGKAKITTNGVLGAAGSTIRARRKPATRTPKTETNNKPEAAGRGTRPQKRKELTFSSCRDQSVQRELAGATAPEELTWIEERVEGGHSTSTAARCSNRRRNTARRTMGQKNRERAIFSGS